MSNLKSFAEDVTLQATLTRIQRKIDIMALDAGLSASGKANTEMKQNIREVQLLIGIALRCIK
jgi:hypothetical protein